LSTRLFGRNLISLPSTGSTNDVLKELAARGVPEGTVVVTDEQTAGRGRLSRRWFAPRGTSLLLSILFRPSLDLRRASWLTMLSSLSATDAVRQTSGLEVVLKWPNDLIVEGEGDWRKLAGVLTETGLVGEQLEFVVVGIGINVNVEPGDLSALAQNATSILAETGQEVDRGALLAALLEGVEARYQRMQAGESPREEWAACLATIGCRVQATTSEGAINGVAETVDENGALLLRTSDGGLVRLLAGDVTLT
jgi:BirA family biotin operon repressor/biotin-[acetyl-CoA-carboxylase] ligase